MNKEMKDSGIEWLGEIPKHWSIGKVKNHYKFVTGFTPDTKNDEFYSNKGGHVWVNISDLIGEKYIYDSKKKISDIGIESAKGNLIPKGSLLYSFKLSVGDVSIAGCDLYTNEAIASFIKEDTIDINFLYYSAPYFIKMNANENIYGAKILNQQLIKNANIIFPPLNEQQQISNFLDEKINIIDKIIDKNKKVIEEYREYKQSLIIETVTKGLNPNVKLKDSWIDSVGKIPEHWKVTRLKNIFSFNSGLTITKRLLKNEGIDCINYGDIHSKYTFDLDLTRDILPKVDESFKKTNPNALITNGDFVFCDTSEDLVGSGNFIFIRNNNGKAIFAGSHTIIARPKENLDSAYIGYTFKAKPLKSQIEERVSGVKLYSITQGILKDIKTIVPPLEEQIKISEYLDKKTNKVDQIILEKQELLIELKDYKKSLIFECVTGKRKII